MGQVMWWAGLRGCGRPPHGTMGRVGRDGRIVGGAAAVRLVHHAHTAHPGDTPPPARLPWDLGEGRGSGEHSFLEMGSLPLITQNWLRIVYESLTDSLNHGFGKGRSVPQQQV